MEKAHIEKVVQDHRGIVLTVSGVVKLFVPMVEGDGGKSGDAKWITLPMKSGEIRFIPGEVHVPTAAGSKKYFERIQAMKGTEQLLQMWGTEATIEGGHVAHITARDVHPLFPQKGERRFNIDRLGELDEESKSK